jgi:hypothetical protein
VEQKTAQADVVEVLQAARDKATLVDIINEASAQLQRGALDLTLLSGVLQKDGGAALESVSEHIKTGFPEKPQGTQIDSLPRLSASCGGLLGFWAVAGEPGVGKSTLAWQLALDYGREHPVLYYDFESGFGWLMERTKQIFEGNIERTRTSTNNIYYRDSIRSLDRDLASIGPPALVVVDSIQKLPTFGADRRFGLDRWVHRLEGLKRRGYSILGISEVPRSAYEGDPNIGVFKETGEIEYSADTALHLIPGAGESVDVHVVKNRHYPTKGYVCSLRRIRGWWMKESGD